MQELKNPSPQAWGLGSDMSEEHKVLDWKDIKDGYPDEP